MLLAATGSSLGMLSIFMMFISLHFALIRGVRPEVKRKIWRQCADERPSVTFPGWMAAHTEPPFIVLLCYIVGGEGGIESSHDAGDFG